MYHVSSDGTSVKYLSKLGVVRTYNHTQWDMIWPKLLTAMFR